ncbi:MAG: SRPBCC domain-containing protein [Acidimicrobiia bacterium]|nr:SRPBCC domain-containing protein [Acidimicrobiia bacterium]
MSDAPADTHTTVTDLDAAPGEVWQALTSPEGVDAWLGNGSHLSPVEGSDLDVADIETGVRKRGRVDTVEPGRRLGFVWWPAQQRGDDGDAASRVVIQLVPDGDGTHLTVTESPLDISLRRTGVTDATASLGVHAWVWRAAAVEVDLLSRPHVLVRPTC